MWAIIKYKKNCLSLLKKDLVDKLGTEPIFYNPKLKLCRYVKSKIKSKEHFLLGDYIFCFNKKFKNKSTLNIIKYSKGLKYFLTEFFSSQNEIEKFIKKCKENEDENGYIKQTFFDYSGHQDYELISGPFSNLMINILEEKKLIVKGLVGKYRISVSKKENLFRPA